MKLKYLMLLTALCTISSFAHSKPKIGETRVFKAQLTEYTCYDEDGCYLTYKVKNKPSESSSCEKPCEVFFKKLKKSPDNEYEHNAKLKTAALISMKYGSWDIMGDPTDGWIIQKIKF